MTTYIAGDNVPGYLPDNVDLIGLFSFEDAQRQLINEMSAYADVLDESGTPGCRGMANDVAAAAEDVNLWAETNADLVRHGRIGLTAGGREWWIAREVES